MWLRFSPLNKSHLRTKGTFSTVLLVTSVYNTQPCTRINAASLGQLIDIYISFSLVFVFNCQKQNLPIKGCATDTEFRV